MDIEELYRCVFNNVSKNQYDKAFEIALSAYQSYTLNELDEFFRKSPPVYNMVGISGSGGSNIAKPNIGTLTAYHLAKIFQVENFNISIVKFGSRKRTSVSGSVDFGETINSIPFKLVDDSCFNKTISYLTFNESIHKYIDEHYVVSIPTSKRLVFCKSKVEADHKLTEGKGIGYERWAKKYNLKAMAQTLILLQEHGLLNEDALDQRIAELDTKFHESLTVVKDLEGRMKANKELRYHVAAYTSTKNIAQQLKAAKQPTAFEEQHRAELTAYRAATAYFKANNITKLPSPKKLEAEYA